MPHFMNTYKKNKNSGFTLLEVMVVTGIISVIIGIAVPNVIAWLPKYRLKSAARDIISFMQEVKLEAIKTNTTLEIIFDNSGTPGYYYLDLNKDGNHDPGEQRVNLSGYLSGVSFGSGSATNNWETPPNPITSSVTFNVNKLRFSARGMSNTPGTVFINNKNNDICYAVTVLTTGSINIRKWTGTAWTN
ncbi:GspH/FimT family pseudopilin [Desulfobacter latus]|uniref:Type II secretion system protein H n=1 Tax=Desulfobacter latus TaxID=2292 RepID=A0A850TEJ3_9BACT|nr:GspH/FimT family pseudopilin [Desulfobacter latus]NWH06707.1 GspH/FimT family pseudopilin [Desulfobacter latus]